MNRIILHIDMNSYFASVEQQANPFLRGKPVGVCSYLSPRGVIIASSPEAKAKGIKTGCIAEEARKLDPKIVLLENEPAKYHSTTEKIFKILSEYTDRLEPYSIDEAFDGNDVGQLIQVAVMVDSSASSFNFYKDGTLMPDTVGQSGSSGIGDSNSTFYNGVDYSSLSKFFDGLMDELRVSSTGTSSNWIATGYNNQDNPATFSSGSDQMGGSATSTSETVGSNLQNLNYTYDTVGNITKIEDYASSTAAKIIEFTYDDLYRLTVASTTNASTTDYIRTYSYNAIGNITSKSDQGDYYYTGNQGTGFANPHAVTDVASSTYSYDNNGNLTNDGVWTHSWDWKNRLSESGNGIATTSYAYDHDVNRVEYNNGSAIIYYPNKYYNESSTGTSTLHIFAGNKLIATIESNGISTSTYYIHTDHLGSSNVISNSEGAIEQILDYYPFGDIRMNEAESGFDEEKKYTGHIHDDETNLNYLIARYQNPAVGRFLSADPIYRELGDLRKINNAEYNYEIYRDKQFEILLNPQSLNTPRTMGNLNSASEFSSQKNTRSKNKSISIQDEYLAKRYNWDEYLINPQLQNSYSYAANNPLKYVDPNGETPALALPLVVPATEAIIATAGTAIAGVTGYIMSRNITWDPGRQITPRIFNDSAPDETNLFPNGMPPKWPQWKKAATAIGIGVAAIGSLIYEKYQSMKDSVQKVEDTQKAIDRQSQYKDGPVWRNDPRRETIRSAN